MKIAETDFQAWMGGVQARMEHVLGRVLPAANVAPARLHEAMRYATLEGGKRVRPLLAFAAGEVSGAPQERVEIAAAAVEMIHAYSLVHDDRLAYPPRGIRGKLKTASVIKFVDRP